MLLTVAGQLPRPIKKGLRAVLNGSLSRFDPVTRNVILGRLGIVTDFSGYERLIKYIEDNRIYELEGDFLEIGAFMGGGSAKLAKYAARHGKNLNVIDVFDPGFDNTPTVRGQLLGLEYQRALGSKNQRQVFDRNTRDCRNITVYAEDSAKVRFPAETRLCFTFIDGNHDPKYVESDFYLAWKQTVPGGVVSFHDYVEGGGELPEVTNAIDGLIATNKSVISSTFYLREGAMMLIRKR
jgi:hypothetical protein